MSCRQLDAGPSEIHSRGDFFDPGRAVDGDVGGGDTELGVDSQKRVCLGYVALGFLDEVRAGWRGNKGQWGRVGYVLLWNLARSLRRPCLSCKEGRVLRDRCQGRLFVDGVRRAALWKQRPR